MSQFTEDDEGKTVINPVGDEVGIVKVVKDGDAYVDPHPTVADQIKTHLGWEDDPGMNEAHLKDKYIDEITDSQVKLRQDLSTDQTGPK